MSSQAPSSRTDGARPEHFRPLTIADNVLSAIVAMLVGYALATHIHLPYSRPSDVEAPVGVDAGWNPETNFFQVVLTVLIAVILFVGLRRLLAFRETLWRFALGVISFGFIAAALAVNAVEPAVDYFHGGEQLAPAAAFLAGKQPYSEIFVIHGMGEDVLRPALGAVLFGGGDLSIARYLLVTFLFRLAAAALALLLVALVVRHRTVFLAMMLVLPASAFGGFSYARMILVYVVMITLYLAFRAKRLGWRVGGYAVAGAAASLAWFDSLDAALMATAVVGVVFLVDIARWLFRRGRAPWRSAVLPALSMLATAVVVQVLGLLVLGVTSYLAFLRISLLEIPRYQSAFSNLPVLDASDSFYAWVPVLIAGALGILLAIAWPERKNIVRRDGMILLIILVAALVSLRFSYGRADLPHAGEWATFVIIGFAVVVSNALLNGSRQLRATASVFSLLLVLACLFSTPQVLSFQRLLSSADAGWGSVARDLVSLPGRSDDVYLGQDVLEISSELGAAAGEQGSLFVFTNDPLLYYTSGLENPSEFYVTWFADPDALAERLLDQLRANPPAVIVVDGPFGVIDGLTSAERLPEVAQWIDSNYTTRVTINGYVVATRE